MKKDIHPKYQKVLFVDSSTEAKYIIGTTLQCEEKETVDGVEYPVCRVAISSSSHPFFVGGKQFVDTEGRVDKFQKRYLKVQQKAQEQKQQEQQKEEEEKKAKVAAKAKKAKSK